jgi:outer membrane protein TolC
MMTRDRSRALPRFAAAIVLTCAGCAVGPDFKRPAAPDVEDYSAHPLSATVATNVSGGEAQIFAKGKDISADWWTLFQSAPLNELIDNSLANNHDLKAAQPAVRGNRDRSLPRSIPTPSSTISSPRRSPFRMYPMCSG